MLNFLKKLFTPVKQNKINDTPEQIKAINQFKKRFVSKLNKDQAPSRTKSKSVSAPASPPASDSRGKNRIDILISKINNNIKNFSGQEKAVCDFPFSSLQISPELLQVLTENNFINPTKVQAQTIDPLIAGKNIICSSQTGSGKTLAFIIPMIERLYQNKISQALILCPTREIALQTQKVLSVLLKPFSFTCATVIGGTDMKEQKKKLREYPHILVATPGRLLDMLQQGLVWLEYTGYVVLDEGDRMLDMGFEDELLAIHKQLPQQRQTSLFTATLFPELKYVASRYGSDYKELIIGTQLSTADNVEHSLLNIDKKDKPNILKKILKNIRGSKLVFFNTINETSATFQKLRKSRFNDISCIHSKKNQPDRIEAIENLREQKVSSLLATDVAARGIDIPTVDLVVNYDIPNNPEEYIHRIGRTGRAGKKGRAVSFCTKQDKRYLKAIQNILKKEIKTEI